MSQQKTARLRIRKDPDSPLWDGEYVPWELDFMEPKEPGREYLNETGLDTHDRTWSGSLSFATFTEAVEALAGERTWCLQRINEPDHGDRWYAILADLYGTDEPTMRTALTPTHHSTQNDGARRSEDTDR